MKTRIFPAVTAVALLLCAFALVFTACSDGGGGGGGSPGDPNDPGVQKPVVPLKKTYVSYDADLNEYKLVLTEVTTGRAMLDPEKNYTYALTITFVNGTKATSTGTVAAKDIDASESNSIKIILTHSGGQTITIAVSSSDDSNTGAIPSFAITSENDTIPVDSNSAVKNVPIPAASYRFNEAFDPYDGIDIGWILIKGEVLPDGKAAPILKELPDGKPVIGIGYFAFANNKNLKSIEIPAHITHIRGWGNFLGCENLATVTFESGSKLELIGGGAFKDCTKLTSIEIPASVKVFGNLAGEGWGTFWGCTNLKTMTFAPNSKLEIIGSGTFQECTNLTGIEIPASVTTINNGAFYQCESLKTVTFESGSKLKTIGIWAFNNCTSLTSIEIPASVTSIGIGNESWQGAFSGCKNLKTITFAAGSQLETIGNSFLGCENLETVTFGSDSKLKTIGNAAFRERENLTSITIPANVTSIGEMAFSLCTSISAITIPAGVTHVGDMVFESWEPSQTINIQGHASEASADAAWGAAWRDDCDATINYNG